MDSEAYKEMIALQERHWWFVARREVIQTFIKLHMPNSLQTNVLEIGCGVGGNVELLGRSGKYLGIDMHLPAIAYCSEKFPQFRFECARIEDIAEEFDSNKFDAIYILDVLEHLDTEIEILRAVRNYLAKDGKILITVPAYQFLWSPHDDFVHHIRRYTKKNLCKVLTDAGYKVERISYFNSILFPLALIQRLGSKLLKKKLSAHLSIPLTMVNSLFRVVFSQESWILKHTNLPFGLSIIAVVTKQSDL